MEHRDRNAPLAKLIYTTRNSLGLTQSELARRAGIHPSFVSKLEAGTRGDPSAGSRRLGLDVCARLSQALGLDANRVRQAAGWVDNEHLRELSAGQGTVEAIMTDPQLTSEQRRMLVDLYRQFTAGRRPR